jgi:RNA polymerase sigma-70 factor (ECF subfamily)
MDPDPVPRASVTKLAQRRIAPVDSLSARFARREPGSIDEAYLLYGARLYATAHRLLGDQERASEAVQEAFLRAWQKAHTYDDERPLGPWLQAICRRTAIDAFRRHRRDPGPVDDASLGRRTAPVPDGLEDIELMWEVRAALDRLPDGEREVMRLAHLRGLTYPEIADLLDLPVGTVKSRTHRAHRRLAADLGHLRDTAR